MSWSEFCTLLSGLMPDTPFGRVVGIRAEKDKKVLDTFTPEQKRIRNEWLKRKMRKLKEDPKAYSEYVARLQAFCRDAFSVKE